MSQTMELPYMTALAEEMGGFDMSLMARNASPAFEKLTKSLGPNVKSFKKTGTTICGVVTSGGVVIGADTRATAGSIVADKHCNKLHRLSKLIWTAGAGTAADLDHTTVMIESKLELLRLSMGSEPLVINAVTMLNRLLFKYGGHIQCALVLGGVDKINGPQLFQIHPHGSTDKLPFTAMGSGSLLAMATLESGYKNNMSIEAGKELVADAISAGIFNDLGSGGNVDLTVITKTGVEYFRSYRELNSRIFRLPQPISFPRGTTSFLSEEKKAIISELRKSVIVAHEDVQMR